MEQHLRLSQVINLALGVLLIIGIALTVYAINQVRTMDTEAASKNKTAVVALNESNPHFAGNVTFTTTVPKLAGWEHSMVSVWCYQSGKLVYAELAHPDSQFKLGGGSSDWVSMGGGAADCTAKLHAYGTKGQRESIRDLASTSFHAAAQ